MSTEAPSRPGGLTQWPVLAAAGGLYALLLLWTLGRAGRGTPLTAGEWLALALFLLFLAAAGTALAILANGLLEGLAGRLPGPLLDGLRAAAVALWLALTTVSLLKFQATSVHLRALDLWFGAHNLGQIWQESLGSESVALMLFLVGATLVLAAVWAGLRTSRRRASPAPVLPLLLLALLTAGGAAVTRSLYRPVRLLGAQLVPELYWLGRSELADRLRRPPPAPPGGAGQGAPMLPYQPTLPVDAPNVVLVMLESLPWSRTPMGGGPPEAAPNLARLAAESVVFSRAYTPSSQSDYAQTAILSSLHPRKYEHHDFYVELEYPRTLVWDALGAAGYTTTMFSCQNERWGNMLNYLDDPGPDLLRHSLHWPRARRRGRGAESKVFEETPVGEWIRWRRASGVEPYFTYLNFQATHFPYRIPPEAPRPFAPHHVDFPASFVRYPREGVTVMLNRFHNALRYSDAHLGRVVEHLRAAGEWERTVLVVVSDHGEAFYEHDQVTHGSSLLEEQVRSVLLLRLPGERPRLVEEPVSLLDVVPTLVRHLGLPAHGNFQGRDDVLDPGYSARGRPLLLTLQGMTREDGVLLDDWKYVLNLDRRQAALYHLAADPGETANLVEAEPQRARRLHDLLAALLARQVAAYRAKAWEEGRYPPPLP